MDTFFSKLKNSINKNESDQSTLKVAPPRKRKAVKRNLDQNAHLNSCLSIQSLPAMSSHPMYPIPYPYGYALPIVPVPINVWQAYLNHIGQSPDSLNRNFQSVQNFCAVPDQMPRRGSPISTVCEDERRNDFKSIWNDSDDESKIDSVKLLDAFKNLEKNVYQFKKFMTLDQTVNKHDNGKEEACHKYPSLSQRSVIEESSKIKSLAKQDSAENNNATWVLKEVHSEFKENYVDNFRKYRKKVISTLCIGYGFDQDDWMIFQELVNYNLKIEDKMAYLNPRHICLENLNAGVALLRNSLLSISKYGESVLKSSWKETSDCDQINLDQNIQWQKIKGCFEILHLFGYDWASPNHLSIKNSRVDKMFIAELTLDLLILAEEFRLYLDGIHSNPIYITQLFARKSKLMLQSPSISIDENKFNDLELSQLLARKDKATLASTLLMEENKLEGDLKVSNISSHIKDSEDSKQIFEGDRKPLLPPKTKIRHKEEVLQADNPVENKLENENVSQQVKKVEHIYEEIVDMVSSINISPPLPKKGTESHRAKKHKRPAPMPPTFGSIVKSSQSLPKLGEQSPKYNTKLKHKVCEKCGKISLRESSEHFSNDSQSNENNFSSKEKNDKIITKKQLSIPNQAIRIAHSSLENIRSTTNKKKLLKSCSLPNLFYYTVENICSKILRDHLKSIITDFKISANNLSKQDKDFKYINKEKLLHQNEKLNFSESIEKLYNKDLFDATNINNNSKNKPMSEHNTKMGKNTLNDSITDAQPFDKIYPYEKQTESTNEVFICEETETITVETKCSTIDTSIDERMIFEGSEIKSYNDHLSSHNDIAANIPVNDNIIQNKDQDINNIISSTNFIETLPPLYTSTPEGDSKEKKHQSNPIPSINTLNESECNSLQPMPEIMSLMDAVPYISDDDSKTNSELKIIFSGSFSEENVPTPPDCSPPSSSLGSVIDIVNSSLADDSSSESLHRVPVMFHANKEAKLVQTEEERYEIPEPLRMPPEKLIINNPIKLPPKNIFVQSPRRPRRKLKNLPPLPPKPREKSPPPLPARITANGMQSSSKNQTDKGLTRSFSFPNSLSNNKPEPNCKSENDINLSPKTEKKQIEKSKGYWPQVFCSCVTPEPQ